MTEDELRSDLKECNKILVNIQLNQVSIKASLTALEKRLGTIEEARALDAANRNSLRLEGFKLGIGALFVGVGSILLYIATNASDFLVTLTHK